MTLSKGLTAHWILNNSHTVNGELRDETPLDITSTFIGTPVITENGPLGGSYEFDGLGTKGTLSPYNPLFGEDSCTITLWANIHGPSNESLGYSSIINCGANAGSGGSADGWSIGARNNNYRIDSGDGTGTQTLNIGIEYDTWYLFTLRSNGDTGEVISNAFGMDEFVGQSMSDTGSTNIQRDTSISIARQRVDDDTFPGEVAEVRLYNRVLSDEEIQSLRNMRTQKKYRV